jgi:hypothetical protein
MEMLSGVIIPWNTEQRKNCMPFPACSRSSGALRRYNRLLQFDQSLAKPDRQKGQERR